MQIADSKICYLHGKMLLAHKIFNIINSPCVVGCTIITPYESVRLASDPPRVVPRFLEEDFSQDKKVRNLQKQLKSGKWWEGWVGGWSRKPILTRVSGMDGHEAVFLLVR